MASVHPSRSGLVPQSESSDRANDDREKDLRQRLYESRGNRAGGSRQTNREDDRNDEKRASPSYQPFDTNYDNDDGYRPNGNRQRYYEDRRYDNSDDWNGAPPPGAWGRRERGQYQERGGTGDNFLQSRQEQRKASSVTIWPPSPTSPYREKGDEDEKSRKKSSSSRHKESSHRHSKRRSHHSSRHRDDYSDSEEERERRRRHKRKESERDRSSRHRSSSPSRRRKYDDDSEDEYGRERRRRKEKERRREREHSDEDRRRSRHHRSESRREEKEPTLEVKGEAHVSEKGKTPASPDANAAESSVVPEPIQSSTRKIGPQLPQAAEADNTNIETLNARAYGGALLPGEGSAMANFVQEGKRIPRRGEIGLSSDQIEAYEKAGFVMSGSRHNRMNAVRMRKENQVYTAEEQRSMLKLIAEEKQKKETALVEQFKQMVDSIGDD